jgi:mannose-6-phosphate isomerase-like protein (cupin superfamily)
MITIGHMTRYHTIQPDAQRLGFSHSRGMQSLAEVVRLSSLRRRAKDSIYQPTRLAFHMIHLITSGAGQHWSDFEPIDLKQGDVLHIRPEQVHRFDEHGEHDALMLIFDPEALVSIGQTGFGWFLADVLYPSDVDFNLLMRLVRAQFDLDAKAREIGTDSTKLHLLAAILSALASLQVVQRSKIDPTLNHYTKNWSCSLICCFAITSRTHGNWTGTYNGSPLRSEPLPVHAAAYEADHHNSTSMSASCLRRSANSR